MMGRQNGDQASFFMNFGSTTVRPKNHLLRRINVFVTAALSDAHSSSVPITAR